MATSKQQTGEFGERAVTRNCTCPKCKRLGTLVRLPNNFKCADIVCDFCGFLGQVKTANVAVPSTLPKSLLGAAWAPQKERMDSGIYFPLFVVLKSEEGGFSIFYLSADLQSPDMFKPRKPLSATARRAGWQGYIIDLSTVEGRLVRLK